METREVYFSVIFLDVQAWEVHSGIEMKPESFDMFE